VCLRHLKSPMLPFQACAVTKLLGSLGPSAVAVVRAKYRFQTPRPCLGLVNGPKKRGSFRNSVHLSRLRIYSISKVLVLEMLFSYSFLFLHFMV